MNTTINYVNCDTCGFQFYRDEIWQRCPKCLVDKAKQCKGECGLWWCPAVKAKQDKETR